MKSKIHYIIVMLAMLAPLVNVCHGGLSTYQIYPFQQGSSPAAGLVASLSGTTLYGTASGGSTGFGIVFKVKTDGSGFQTLHTFGTSPSGSSDLTDGFFPVGSLVLLGNWLYGVTKEGGANSDGALFAVNINGDTVGYNGHIHDFPDPTVSNDGWGPAAGLVGSASDNTVSLYGTTLYSPQALGTVFSVTVNAATTPAPTQTAYNILHYFASEPVDNAAWSDGVYPGSDLALSGNWLYGTTSKGADDGNPDHNYGTVFVLNIMGDTSGYKTLYSFTGDPTDQGYPTGGLVVSGNNLYGTTSGQEIIGIGPPAANNFGNGTVFGITLNTGSGTPAYQSIWTVALNGATGEGVCPVGDLCFEFVPAGITGGQEGILLGTTLGESPNSNPSLGANFQNSTVFEIKTDGSWLNHTALSSSVGSEVSAGLTLAKVTAMRYFGYVGPGGGIVFHPYTTMDYAFVGTAEGGGSNGYGSIFECNVVPGIYSYFTGYSFVAYWEDPPNLILQSAPSVTGPWSNIMGATSPYTNMITGPQQFFRLTVC
jgi:uncharacterized repeat protein (TIGR03803 family)